MAKDENKLKPKNNFKFYINLDEILIKKVEKEIEVQTQGFIENFETLDLLSYWSSNFKAKVWAQKLTNWVCVLFSYHSTNLSFLQAESLESYSFEMRYEWSWHQKDKFVKFDIQFGKISLSFIE